MWAVPLSPVCPSVLVKLPLKVWVLPPPRLTLLAVPETLMLATPNSSKVNSSLAWLTASWLVSFHKRTLE